MADDAKDNAGVIAPPPLIYALPLLAGLLLNRRVPLPLAPRPLGRPLGFLLIGGGLSLLYWFFSTLKNAGTTVDPREPVERIVTHGPFSRTRNPGYTAMALVYTGLSLVANALWPMLLLPGILAVIQKGVVEREERYLEGKFGDEYRRYRERVPRWL